MASQPDVTELSSAFERLVVNRDMSLILPFFFGFVSTIQRTEHQGPDTVSESIPSPSDRIIFVNPFTQQLVMIEGTPSFDSVFHELGRKDGQPPASKASIEAMPSVEIIEKEECVICLDDMESGSMAKEMPCKHRFHRNCIEKWLELHGSCPVCRYQMPIEEQDGNKKVDDDTGERRAERGIWVNFTFGNPRSGEDSNQTPTQSS